MKRGFLKRTYNGRMRKTNKKTKYKKGTVAITQILILVIATFAFSWMIGGSIKEVNASLPTTTTPATSNSCVGVICSYNKLYGGKLVGGKCVADINNLKQDCTYGCTDGSSTCNLKTSSDSGVEQKISQIATPVATSVLSNQATKILEKIAQKKSADSISKAAAAEAAKTASLGNTLVGSAGGSGISSGGTGFLLGANTALGGAISIVAWSAVAFIMGRYVIAPWLGLNTQQSQSLGYALAAGTAAGLTLYITGATGTLAHTLGIGAGAGGAGGPIGIAVGLVVGFVMFAILAKKSSVDVIQYTCSQWDSQSGKGLTPAQMTQRCKVCNDQKDFVCTEYQCRSLGQGCILINDASSGRQLCIWNNTKDILPPVITPWKEALLNEDFKYNPDNAISPPDRGVQVIYSKSSDGCAPAFTPVSFGVQLNEPAKCKISPEKISNYSWMADVFMGRGIRDYNQSFALSLPSSEAMEAENITVVNGGKYQLYVRCEDANGNSNIGNFVFKFCISQGPDTTAPEILGTSILDKQPIASGQKSIFVDLYVRDQTFTKEDASCRWDYLDRAYSSMAGNMSCTHSLLDINSQMAYTCNTILTGLKDNVNNKFYFRCIDDLGNANTQSYLLTLVGTKPLVINSVSPNATTIKDSTNVVKVNLSVETSAGYDEGKAVCAFSETGKSGSYVDFFYGYDTELYSQYQHSQELLLEEGNYNYFIQCRDKGGNIDTAKINFAVKTDTSPPVVVRVYKEENYLKLITDEPGKCVYSNFGCNYIFSDGTEMSSLNEREYYTDWDISNDYYIKCEDNYGNQPPADPTCNTDACRCSIIVRPFEIFAVQ
jgi:hypothetical protein